MKGVSYWNELGTYVISLVKLSPVCPLGKFVPHRWFIKLVFPLPQGPKTIHLTGWPGFEEGLIWFGCLK